MSAVALSEITYSIQEYLSVEKEAIERCEYYDGFIRGMSGATINHGVLCNNIGTILNVGNQKKEKNCTAIGSEVKVRIEKTNSFVYPDAMLICGDIETSEQDQNIETSEQDQNAVVNPILIVEVLSNSTERHDRSDKFRMYCSLPSFREYVLIDQYKAIVDVLYKADPTYWKMTSAIGLDQSFYLHTLDLEVQMTTLYRGVQQLGPPIMKMDL